MASAPKLHPNKGKIAGDLARTMRLGNPDFVLADRDILRRLLGSLLVEKPSHFAPAGAIVLPQVEAVWRWLVRDIDPGLTKRATALLAAETDGEGVTAFCLEVAGVLLAQCELAEKNPQVGHRFKVQIADQEAFKNLAHIANGFKCQPYLAKAVSFGRALNSQRDDNSIALSLKSFPTKQSTHMPFLMHVAMSLVANPARVVSVVVKVSGAATQNAITKAGFAPVLDALTAQAQDQLPLIYGTGPFADMDLACRAVGRFHLLVRAISIVTETDTQSRWATQCALLIAHISDQLGPRVGRVEADLRQSLRPTRNSAETSDTEMLLEALNGMYLLSTVRAARESLGLNSVLESAWTHTGQVLETLITRNLEAYKNSPEDETIARRLEAAINMAKIRFNPEYAAVVERAMKSVNRRKMAPQR